MTTPDYLRSRADDLYGLAQSSEAAVSAADVALMIEAAATVLERKDAVIATQQRLIRLLVAWLVANTLAIVWLVVG